MPILTTVGCCSTGTTEYCVGGTAVINMLNPYWHATTRHPNPPSPQPQAQPYRCPTYGRSGCTAVGACACVLPLPAMAHGETGINNRVPYPHPCLYLMEW